GRLSYQFSSDGYIRRSVYAYEKNKQAVKHDIGDLAEHADTHGRNLTALGHILCVKTHDDIPKKKSQSD
ncbi:hypothetical protein RPF12_21830, partial [Escherichia coli]|uniref:hypothetical protein n=1 Tax=Escherichia coli TaxID=562 RepID=UPI0028A2FAC0